MTLLVENALWGRPNKDATGTGALVIAGSSGRIDIARVEMLARQGVLTLGLRWFGGPGLPEVPREVALEYFASAANTVAAECDRIVLIGHSYGAEAALLTASLALPVDAVVALAPTDVAWEGFIGADQDPPRSKWTYAGHPIVFPGEGVANLDRPYRVGGDAGAPERLGRAAWPDIARVLRVTNRVP